MKIFSMTNKQEKFVLRKRIESNRQLLQQHQQSLGKVKQHTSSKIRIYPPFSSLKISKRTRFIR